MMLRTLIAAAAFAVPFAVLAQGGATSQPQTGRTPPGAPASPGSIDQRAASGAGSALFDRLDRNNDGFVSRDEAKDASELQGRFVELDENNDGKLSRGEMRSIERGRSGSK